MADPVDFHARLKARQTRDTEYLERLDLTAKMIPIMVETIETFNHMGASRDHVVRILQATIESRDDEARRVVDEYANDLREFIKKLPKPPPPLTHYP